MRRPRLGSGTVQTLMKVPEWFLDLSSTRACTPAFASGRSDRSSATSEIIESGTRVCYRRLCVESEQSIDGKASAKKTSKIWHKLAELAENTFQTLMQ